MLSSDHFYYLVTPNKLNLQELVDLVTSPICGAISTFIGTTRDNFEGKKVKTLEYEAYQGMAEKALLKLCQDIASK